MMNLIASSTEVLQLKQERLPTTRLAPLVDGNELSYATGKLSCIKDLSCRASSTWKSHLVR